MDIKSRVIHIETGLWRGTTLALTFFLSNKNISKDRVIVWYPEYKHKDLRRLLQLFCAPTQKIGLAIDDRLPTQFFTHEINFTHIEFKTDKFGFDKILSYYKGE